MPCLTIAAALARRLDGQATVVAMANPVFEDAVAANVRFIGVGSRDEYERVQRVTTLLGETRAWWCGIGWIIWRRTRLAYS